VTAPEVVEITAAQTHPLRLSVLRFDTPTKVVEFAEDAWPGAIHLALRVDGELVAVSSWVPRPHDDRPAVQLRGMATSRALQGHGLGGVLLEAGCARMAERGETLVWANARDAALAFYLRHGFETVGDGFIDPHTPLPHHRILRPLP
jgi:predicted GNAT family N-acyltransferase